MNIRWALLALVLSPAVALAQATVKMTWDPPEGTVALTGYILEHKVSTDAWTEIGRTTAPPYTETIATTRQPICWRVRAYNAFGPSDPSNELCLATPGVPVNLTLSVNRPATSARSQTTVRSKTLKK